MSLGGRDIVSPFVWAKSDPLEPETFRPVSSTAPAKANIQHPSGFLPSIFNFKPAVYEKSL